MTVSQVSSSEVASSRKFGDLNWAIWPAILAVACLAAYVPTIMSLIDGPWQTEQEGHGPLIIAASLWLAWQARQRIFSTPNRSAPVSGWIVLLGGLFLMFLARTQGVLAVEMFSLLIVMSGCVLLLGGWSKLSALAFPIGFLFFAVPMPDWLIDSATIPLKVLISDAVTGTLYAFGYPVAQNGVMVMIGTYQLLVKDACSGMNSIFVLSAIGVFYAYAFRWNDKVRSTLLILAIIPITIIANFLRVLTLVLLAYYGGVDLIEGSLHEITGLGIFVVAFLMLFLFDLFLGALSGVVERFRNRVPRPPAQATPLGA